MLKTLNLCGIRNRVILSRFKNNVIVLEPITEEIERKMDNYKLVHGELIYKLSKYKYVIPNNSIFLYGEVNFNNNDDIKYLKRYKDLILNSEANSNCIYSNFDYDKGITCYNTDKDNIHRIYETFDFMKWFRFNYCLIGKPQRIIMYKVPIKVIRNDYRWSRNS